MPNSGFNAFTPRRSRSQREEARRRERDRRRLDALDRAADEREDTRRLTRALGLGRHGPDGED